ncbi:protease, partial [Simian T-lymphotropic virus 1]
GQSQGTSSPAKKASPKSTLLPMRESWPLEPRLHPASPTSRPMPPLSRPNPLEKGLPSPKTRHRRARGGSPSTRPPCGCVLPKKLDRGGGLISPQPESAVPVSGPATILPVIPLDPKQRPLIKAEIEVPTNSRKPVQALLDTGADMTVLPLALFPENTPLENTAVVGAGGQTQDQFKIASLPVLIHLPFRTTPIVLTSCLIDTENNWVIIGRDALQQCQGALYLPEAGRPPLILPVQAPAMLGLEHFPKPPEISQFPLNLNASRPCSTWSTELWRQITLNHTLDPEITQCSQLKSPAGPGDSSMT